MCDHSNGSYRRVLSCTFSNFWVRIWNPNVWPFKWKLRRPTLLCCFKLLCLRNKMLNVWPFKGKLQRATLLYFFKRLGPGMKSLIFDHSGESYKGLLSYNFLNVWVCVWNPKCLTIQMKAEGPTFLYFFKHLRPSMNWNPNCVTIQMKAIDAYFPVLFPTFGSLF